MGSAKLAMPMRANALGARLGEIADFFNAKGLLTTLFFVEAIIPTLTTSSVGQTATAYTGRTQDAYIVVFNIIYEDAALDDEIRAFARKVCGMIKEEEDVKAAEGMYRHLNHECIPSPPSRVGCCLVRVSRTRVGSREKC